MYKNDNLAEEVRVSKMKRLLNISMREGPIPEKWKTGLIVSIWKGKGNVQGPGKYRSIALVI